MNIGSRLELMLTMDHAAATLNDISYGAAISACEKSEQWQRLLALIPGLTSYLPNVVLGLVLDVALTSYLASHSTHTVGVLYNLIWSTPTLCYVTTFEDDNNQHNTYS